MRAIKRETKKCVMDLAIEVYMKITRGNHLGPPSVRTPYGHMFGMTMRARGTELARLKEKSRVIS